MGRLGGKGELEARLTKLRAATPREVLGVSAGADAAAIRQAFLQLTKETHPHRYAREAPEVRELATEVFLLVRRAYDELRTNTANTANTAAVTAPAAVPAAKAERPRQSTPPVGLRAARTRVPIPSAPPELRAEQRRRADFEKARALLGAGQVDEARTLFQRVAAEEPDRKEYRGYLAYALGLQHKAQGRDEHATREIERALALVDIPDAHAELAALRPKSEGLLSRWFGSK